MFGSDPTIPPHVDIPPDAWEPDAFFPNRINPPIRLKLSYSGRHKCFRNFEGSCALMGNEPKPTYVIIGSDEYDYMPAFGGWYNYSLQSFFDGTRVSIQDITQMTPLGSAAPSVPPIAAMPQQPLATMPQQPMPAGPPHMPPMPNFAPPPRPGRPPIGGASSSDAAMTYESESEPKSVQGSYYNDPASRKRANSRAPMGPSAKLATPKPTSSPRGEEVVRRWGG